MMNPRYPKSIAKKIPTPADGPGNKTLDTIKSGPNVFQSIVKGQRIRPMKKGPAASYAKKKSNPRVPNRGGKAKIAQGGENEGSHTGISRTNMGRQKL